MKATQTFSILIWEANHARALSYGFLFAVQKGQG